MARSVMTISFGVSIAFFATAGEAAIFTVVNQCPYTVWVASVPVGGGRQLNRGESWTIRRSACPPERRRRHDVVPVRRQRPGLVPHGRLRRRAAVHGLRPVPNTLAEFALNQFNNLDFFDVSLIDGFNLRPGSRRARVPQPRGAVRGGRHGAVRCPPELRQDGACNNACPVFKRDEYCCVGSAANRCGSTNYSRFFKGLCPDAYSYPKDDATSTFTCPAGTNYRVVFCP
ncbi:hypothetical protein EJB05_11621, partial [Eragrostis curvula]